MERYFKTDIRRMPLGIVWSWSAGSALYLALRKLLPVPFYAPALVPEQLAVNPVAEASADPGLLRMVAGPSAELLEMGFAPVLLYTVPTLGPTRSLGRALLQQEGSTVCLLIAVVTGESAQTSVHLLSAERAGALLGTSSAVLRMPPVPGIEMLRLPGAPPAQVAAAHLGRLAGRSLRRFAAEDVEPVLRELQQRSIEYYVSIGLYVEASPADIERARRA